MNGNVILGNLSTGEPVYDRYRSHLDNGLREIIREVLLSIGSSDRRTIEEEVEFNRVIGRSNLVETTEDDDIVYAKRVNRKNYSRLVKLKVGPECSTSYVKLIRDKKADAYILVTAFIGAKTPPEPIPDSDNQKLKKFWSTHALSYESVSIQHGTETKAVPTEFLI